MPVSYVEYGLREGYVHHWLVAGPQAVPLAELERFPAGNLKEAIARHYHQEESGIAKLPVERGPLTEGTFRVDDYEGAWSYLRCREDHLVDHTARYPTYHYLRSWAYVQLVSEAAQEVALVLSTHGPADLWLNGRHVHRREHLGEQLQSSAFRVGLAKGANGVLVRFEQVAAGDGPYALALRVCRPEMPGEPAAGVATRLPTTIRQLQRRNTLEQVLEAAYLDRDVFGRDDHIVACWPEDLEVSAEVAVRLQSPAGRIYGEAHAQGSAGDRAWLGRTHQLAAGPYRVILMPRPTEYYDDNVRIRRELTLWGTGNNGYSEVPYGTPAQRRQEALQSAARCEGSLFAETARMALGQWAMVDAGVILGAVERADRREEGSALDLVALLGMLYRYGGRDEFPASVRQPLEACVLGYRYWHDEPGRDAMGYTSESRSLLFHTAETLAGQLYLDRTFGNSGRTGQEHREKGERLALDWLRRRAAYGFAEWGSSCAFAEDLVALSHLVDLAEADPVYQMAAVIVDKMLFTMALNSHRGVFGSTHGCTCWPAVQSGLLEPTAGITRLLWGQGVFNHHLAGTVSLACTQHYELPPIIADIAASPGEELWGRERHATGPEGDGQDANLVTYRTPDYMLSSAQAYRPGEPGTAEHIWQATLGPAAVVFANHPARASDGDARRPGFWLGNRVLPRVAQWKDVMIAVHRLPEDDWMGFTHAYFPTHAFDEYLLHQGWAFARRGDGYLALTAAQGLTLIEGGHSAWRELRSYGRQNVWLCHMGRAALDGDFAAFQRKVLALDVDLDGLAVRCHTLRGDVLSFGWEGPLLRNGQAEPLAGFRHYENPYTTVELGDQGMEVRTDAYLLRLDFRAEASQG